VLPAAVWAGFERCDDLFVDALGARAERAGMASLAARALRRGATLLLRHAEGGGLASVLSFEFGDALLRRSQLRACLPERCGARL
jgi:hypothetical protein